jgi:peptidoglycan/LPS O-acetylase OafA/YrhL
MPIAIQPQTNHASLERPDAISIVRPLKSQRIPALDFTKGALVLIMVLYHWVNYFIGPQWKYYEYLRFLTPSFIFISGFMISHVYLSKYAAADHRLSKRLFTRGMKLLAIFVVLNLFRGVIVPVLGTDVVAQHLPSLAELFTVFVSGNFQVVGTKLVSFPILVPISYLLMLSGVLVVPYRFYRPTFGLACALFLLSIFLLGLSGNRSFNVEFIAIGLLGVLAGFIPATSIGVIGRYRYLLACAYLLYLTAITIWNVPFLLLIVGVLLSLTIIYLIGDQGSESGVVQSEVNLLGKYSLLGYISQVAILQILSAGFHRVNLGSAALPVSFLLAFMLTIGSVEAVDRARAKSASVDRLYKAVFA